MKRAFAILLVLALLIPVAAFAEEAETYSYIAFGQWSPFLLDDYGLSGDPDRLILATIVKQATFWAIPAWLPDSTPENGEHFALTGIRITLDKPIETYDLSYGTNTVFTPIAVEKVGEVVYGRITAIGDGYILHDAYADTNYTRLSGNPQRYAVTEDTLRQYDVAYRVDLSCEVIVDADGVVLVIKESNG